MYQQTEIIGHVGSVSEVRKTANGAEVINFSVAVNLNLGHKEETTWFNVVAWNGLANVVAEYVEKGKKLMVQGRISAEAYLDKDGKPQAQLKLTAMKILFL